MTRRPAGRRSTARRPTRWPWRFLLVGGSVPALMAAAPPTVGGATVVGSVSLAAGAAASDTVLVAARELPRGTVLRASDMDTVVTHGDAPASYGRSPTGASADRPDAGWMVRRLVHKGEPLRPPAVAPPPLIPAGSAVSLVWEVDGLRVTRAGTAIGAAHAGESVTVRVDARRRFTGIATAPGTVVVGPP